jgi:hypothetical protein
LKARDEVLVHSINHSTSIDGKPLPMHEVADLIEHGETLAPSAVNRQPWGFDLEDDSITVHVRTGGPEFSVSKRLDCGIAMLHIEVAAMSCGVRGEWQFLKAPQVARFSASAETAHDEPEA